MSWAIMNLFQTGPAPGLRVLPLLERVMCGLEVRFLLARATLVSHLLPCCGVTLLVIRGGDCAGPPLGRRGGVGTDTANSQGQGRPAPRGQTGAILARTCPVNAYLAAHSPAG